MTVTKREAAIVTIYTGISIGEFSDAHEYAEEIMGYPIWTHEFASKSLWEKLKELSKPDFMAIKIEEGSE
jgi:hypothetical protein